MKVKKQQLELDMEQGLVQFEKGVQQSCILSPCLTFMQSTSCEMQSWMNLKLKPRLSGEISTTLDADDTILMAKMKRN